DQLFGDVWLETFGMTLVQPDKIGDDPASFAIRIGKHLSLSRGRQQTPRRVWRVLPCPAVDVSGVCIGDLMESGARTASVLRRPFRSLRQAFVVHLALASLEDE